MSNLAVSAEGLGKRYRINFRQTANGTRMEALASAVQAPFRALQRCGKRAPIEFWALRDISFEVEHGKVLGIIGRNGAGKSTLLKILSRVTDPTSGRALVRGRVGSLLEVGTGFHPELTGRENIYVNGAVLGMKKRDMDRNFDAIVAFADVERFLDTPVKRYSSGMYMRLAFSIAAHLEPEVLIVDEVLAVGDAAFQKKCLGVMDHVAKEGRTVLLVSHSMSTIMSLCDTTMLLNAGRLVDFGPTPAIVQRYLESEVHKGVISLEKRQDRSGDGSARIVSLQIEGESPDDVIRSASRLKITIGYESDRPVRYPQFVVSIHDHMDIGLFLLHNEFVGGLPESLPPAGSVTCLTEPINLTPGRCVVHLELLKGNVQADCVSYAGYFDVEPEDIYGTGMLPPRDWVLCVLKHRWWLNDE